MLEWHWCNYGTVCCFLVEIWKDDLDELEVYGKEEQPGVKLTSYTFEVSRCFHHGHFSPFTMTVMWQSGIHVFFKGQTNIGFILLGVWQFAKYWTLHLHWYGRTCISLGKFWHCYLSFLILFVLTEYRFLIFIKYNNLINILVLADNKLFASVQYLFRVIAVI